MIKALTLFMLSCTSLCFGKYYSQCEQDKFINEHYFHNMKNGVFLDVGAHDGISYSNTYFYESELGWKGICIEPMPEVYEELKKNRTCSCICACANPDHNVYKDFARIKGPLEMFSGLVEKLNPTHWKHIQEVIRKQGHTFQIIKVRCVNLNKLLEEEKITHINLFSLDIEGGELEILKSLDFSKITIDVITVEDNFKNPEFISFLEGKGFKFITALRQDKVFVNKKSGLLK